MTIKAYLIGEVLILYSEFFMSLAPGLSLNKQKLLKTTAQPWALLVYLTARLFTISNSCQSIEHICAIDLTTRLCSLAGFFLGYGRES